MRVAIAALGLLLLPSIAAAQAKCQLAQIAVWPVQLTRGLPVVQGALNGQKAGILLDTGAYASMVTRDTARRLDLFTRDTGQMASGVGGNSRVQMTRVDELRIADATVKDMRVRVIGERPIPGVDFILGDDFFRRVDLEFDYAKGSVRVYRPSEGCKASWLGYWDPQALQVPVHGDRHILVPVKINGRDATAMLDSGASSSVVSMQFAEKVGITPSSPGVMPASCSMGVGAGMVRNWVAPFESVFIGGETIRDARLHVMDMDELSQGRDGVDIILGTDFLRTHRVFISRLQDKAYFTYTGGQVFPNTAQRECDERVLRGKSDEALAAYEEALATNPRDAKALMGRAGLRWRAKDLKGALADLDAVLAIEPGNGIALAERMEIRALTRDFDGALADSDAALANGMRSPELHVNRALIWAAKREPQRVLQDAEEALRLSPSNPTALRLRGRYLFHAGRYEAAEQDFATRLAIQRSAYDALWISLARARRGADGKPVLEQWLAQSKEGAWPQPVVEHFLGRIDRDRLFAIAAAEPEKRAGRACEARFYVAESLIASGKREEARPLLVQARQECPRDYLEYDAADMELATR